MFGVLGINLGFHRLITHRGFTCPLWLEHTFAVLGTFSLQFSPAFWVAVHRRHHHHADEEQDQHLPLRAHFGWLLRRLGDMRSRPLIDRYAKDVMRDPLYAMLERRKNWIKISFLLWLVYFAAGYAWVMASGGSAGEALQFGSSLVIWACGTPLGPLIQSPTFGAIAIARHPMTVATMRSSGYSPPEKGGTTITTQILHRHGTVINGGSSISRGRLSAC
jgi:fatty acid desaturase